MKKILMIVGAVIFVMAGIIYPAFAADRYEIEWSKGIGGGLNIFAVEDIDNDGIIEAVGGNSSGFLQTLELKNGKWVEEWRSNALDWEVGSGKIGDLDGNGTKEIVITGNNSNYSTIFVFDASTKQLLQRSPLISAGKTIQKLIDVDKDGKLEILCHFYSPLVANVHILYSSVDIGNLRTLLVYESGLIKEPPIFVDIDNDGITEIIAGKDTWDSDLQDFTGHTISIYNGSSFSLEWEKTDFEGRILTLAVGDVDRDGIQEIIITSYSDETEYMKIYNGITKELEWADSGRKCYNSYPPYRKLEIVDIDNDGVNEIFIYGYRSGEIEIYDGETKVLEWTSRQISGADFITENLEILDIDGDGVKEIININASLLRTIDGISKEIELNTRFNVGLIKNVDEDPQLEFISGSLAFLDGRTGIIENKGYVYTSNNLNCKIGDIDGDGKNEILLPESKDTNTLIHIFDGVTKAEKNPITVQKTGTVRYLFLADTNGNGRKEIFIGIGDKDYLIDGLSKSIIWQGNIGWMPVALADIDSDGQTEVISYNDSYLHIYNFATKQLEWPIEQNAPKYYFYNSYEIDVADVDNDGTMEIIIGADSSWNPGQIYLIDGKTKNIEWEKGVPDGLEGIALADIDKDNTMEILYGNYGGMIHILDGKTKVQEGEFRKMSYLHGLTVGDVDNDGHNDIIATDGWNDWNYLYVFDGITYEQKYRLNQSLGQEAHDIKIIDVDSDGINEIIVQSNGYVNIIGFHPNKPPVFNAISNKQIGEGATLSFTVSATDPDQDAITYSASGLPSGASLDSSTGVFRWTPTYSQQGAYSVTFSAFDGTVSVFKTITITVVDIDPNITHKANIAVTSYTNNVAFNNPIIISANVTNLGTLTWVPSTFKFRTHAYLPDGRYVNDLIGSGYTLPGNILPGEIVTMNLSIPTGTNTQLNILGLYRIGLDMVQEGVKWFGNEVKIDVTIQAPTNNAGFVAQWIPNVMKRNQVYSAAIIMKNTGNIIWKANQGYNLGSQNDRDNTTWGRNRVLLTEGQYPTESVAPNTNKVFTFNVTAPATPGTYNFQWKMVKEYVEWFGQATPNLKITVIPDDNSVIYYSDGTSHEAWQVYDRRGAYGISTVYDEQLQSNAIETKGDYRSGYILGGNWANTTHKIIGWKIKSQNYRVYVKVKVKDRNNRIYNRYITYHPTTHHTQDANNTYISHILPGTADNNWHTITRDLQADLTSGPYGQPNMTLVSVEGFLIRGAARIDDILVKK